ncbi:MAG: pyridoxamine 5'-phosphate oxidase family protein [Candidatus Nitrosocosmicus sp.]
MLKILNGNPGLGVPLNEQETVKFLTTGKLNLHLGTLDKSGYPNVHPVWYYYDTENNRIYTHTHKFTDRFLANQGQYFNI